MSTKIITLQPSPYQIEVTHGRTVARAPMAKLPDGSIMITGPVVIDLGNHGSEAELGAVDGHTLTCDWSLLGEVAKLLSDTQLAVQDEMTGKGFVDPHHAGIRLREPMED